MSTEVTLETLLEMWQTDCHIDIDLGAALAKISRFHAKYLSVRARHNIKAKKYDGDLKTLKKYKWLWLGAKLSLAELKVLGWTPFEGTILKNQYVEYINSEPDVVQLEQVLAYHQEMVGTCDHILKELYSRSHSLNGSVNHARYLSGR